MDQHFNIVAYLNFAYGALIAAAALVVGSILSMIGGLSGGEMSPEEARIVSSIGGFVAFGLLALSLPYFLAGYGILKRFNWGRILGIILGAFALFSIPVGTALGIYAIWALTRPEAQEDFF